jgi:flagellar motility protein MotE (MotC chaperone)
VADTAVQSVLAPELAPGEVERRILERLATRRQELDAREDDLKLREAVVVAAELKLERAFEAFEQERAEIAALRAERDAASTEEVEALVSAYERMKGRDAAAIFNALDEEIMLAVASNMRTQALAAVLAEMDPEKARKLTVLLAERARIVQHDAGAPAGR